MPSTTALISETHLEKEKLVTAAKEARTFSWAGTSSDQHCKQRYKCGNTRTGAHTFGF